jgi:hypothetical protein
MGMALFELIAGHQQGRSAPSQGRDSAGSFKTSALTLVAARCHDSISNGFENFQN